MLEANDGTELKLANPPLSYIAENRRKWSRTIKKKRDEGCRDDATAWARLLEQTDADLCALIEAYPGGLAKVAKQWFEK